MPSSLNPSQQKAVNTLSGPLLVLAGAGSGKTRVVTFRIARLIQSGISPDRILAVTFTNKAAAEMQERIGGLLGKKKKIKPQISTFHSYCVGVLKRHISVLGYPKKFAIYDRSDQESLARTVLRELRVAGQTLRPGDLLYLISSWKSASIRPEQAVGVAETDKEHFAAMGYRRYQKALKLAGAVDFDDLLLLTGDIFAQEPEILELEAGRFDHILVDEYQDTNGSQYEIIRSLADGHQNLCVVGDDDQSIYGWRGADVSHILRFARDWDDATTVRLEENYRSTAAILKLANTLIAFNNTRHDKVLKPARHGGEKPRIEQYKDETVEAKCVVADIQRRLREPGMEARDIAILFRTKEQPRPFEQELRAAKVPYVLIGGQSFFDRKEVRDLLAFLRVIDHPDDEVSLLRIINMPPRGISSGAVQKLTATAVKSGETIWKFVSAQQPRPDISRAATVGCDKFTSLIKQCRAMLKSRPIADMCRFLIEEIKYEAELRRLYPEGDEQQTRINSVEEVVNAIASYEQKADDPSLAGFLEETALAGKEFDSEKEKQLRRNGIVLMTLHAAKGLEFPQVYMVGMEEGLLPHHRSVKMDGAAIDEERRLCYVGITRAQDRLTLSLAQTRMKWGKPRDTNPSRFLFEMIGKAENPYHSKQLAEQRAGRKKQS